jgi:hypothetical protein
VVIWLFVFVSTGWMALAGTLLAATGLGVYLVKNRLEKKKQNLV